MKKIRRKKKTPPSEGKVRNATPNIYDGIKFRSRLETYCYQKLKEAGIVFKYEEDNFILIEAFTFINDSYEFIKSKKGNRFDLKDNKIRKMTYTPDFTNLDKGWIIECKGNPNDAFPIKWKMFKQYITKHKLNYNLYMPKTQKQVDEIVEIIKEKYEHTIK